SKLPRHRQFSYKPLYYNEEKEELHARVRETQRKMGDSPPDRKDTEENIRKAFRDRRMPERYGNNPLKKNYALRLLLIAGFLSFIFYKFLNSNLMEIIFGL